MNFSHCTLITISLELIKGNKYLKNAKGFFLSISIILKCMMNIINYAKRVSFGHLQMCGKYDKLDEDFVSCQKP
jgi:hypothetical protein